MWEALLGALHAHRWIFNTDTKTKLIGHISSSMAFWVAAIDHRQALPFEQGDDGFRSVGRAQSLL